MLNNVFLTEAHIKQGYVLVDENCDQKLEGT